MRGSVLTGRSLAAVSAVCLFAASLGVYFGWKDFYTKDTPMLGPVRTIGHRPEPVLISYQ